jgi:hypothetical protein
MSDSENNKYLFSFDKNKNPPLPEGLYLFVHFDLVDSTKLKNDYSNHTRWPLIFKRFYDELRDELTKGELGADFKLWKLLGDAAVFYIWIENLTTINTVIKKAYTVQKTTCKNLNDPQKDKLADLFEIKIKTTIFCANITFMEGFEGEQLEDKVFQNIAFETNSGLYDSLVAENTNIHSFCEFLESKNIKISLFHKFLKSNNVNDYESDDSKPNDASVYESDDLTTLANVDVAALNNKLEPKYIDPSLFDNFLKSINIAPHLFDNFLVSRIINTGLLFDFLGPDIDIGFRITKYAHSKTVTLSAELAYILSLIPTDLKFENSVEKYLKIVGFKKLKGVWSNRVYPIIWYHHDWIEPEDIFDYDEHSNYDKQMDNENVENVIKNKHTPIERLPRIIEQYSPKLKSALQEIEKTLK